ncbi:hypothetical protein DPEC_G00174450 [Dallia pectoralis]|uniref:Uncharacterized protein n=1 Tax=Dallia pectoralis TaxID=75939 RepID=A0ACC2GE92_DALPE|nr:hypothetical protein DPEC_G00174450 [Dallia pectoralis]
MKPSAGGEWIEYLKLFYGTKMMLVTSLGFLMIHFTIHCSCLTTCSRKSNNNLKDYHECNGFSGEQTLLEYMFTPKDDRAMHTILIVAWNKVGTGETVLEYNNNRITSAPGFQFAVPDWNDTNYNVSMLLTNTKMTDMGKYKCQVYTDMGPAYVATATISLIVTDNLKHNREYYGVSGEQTLLEYVFTPNNDGIKLTTTIVSWNKVGTGETVLEYNNNRITSAPGFQFAVPDWNYTNYNVSMLLTNTTMTDMGKYKCQVHTDGGPYYDTTATISLIVTVNSNP